MSERMNDGDGDGRVWLPRNVAAERGVLACCLREGTAGFAGVAARGVDGECFTAPGHVEIWRAMELATQRGLSVDEISVADVLEGEVSLPSINEISESVETSIHLWAWVDLLLLERRHRQALLAGRQLVEALGKPAADMGELQDRMVPYLTALAGLAGLARDVSLREVAEDVIRTTDLAIEGREEEIDRSRQVWLPTADLTKKLKPLDPAEQDHLIVIGGESSHGKSSFARQMAGTALFRGQRVVAFLLETTRRKWLRQVASQRNYVDLMQDWEVTRAENGGPAKIENFRQTLRGLRDMADDRLHVFEDVFQSEEVCARSRMVKERFGEVHLIIVDYLQLLETRQKGRRGDEIIGEHVRMMKNLAKQIGCPLLLLSSLNNEAGPSGPSLRNLRGSGDIRFGADRVWFIHRPEKDANGNEQSTDRKTWQMLVDQAKARDLFIGTVWSQFQPRFVNFVGLPAEGQRGRKPHADEFGQAEAF